MTKDSSVWNKATILRVEAIANWLNDKPTGASPRQINLALEPSMSRNTTQKLLLQMAKKGLILAFGNRPGVLYTALKNREKAVQIHELLRSTESINARRREARRICAAKAAKKRRESKPVNSSFLDDEPHQIIVREWAKPEKKPGVSSVFELAGACA